MGPALLITSVVQAVSGDHLRKINWLLLVPPAAVLSKPIHSLLTPYLALTKSERGARCLGPTGL